MSKNRHDSQKVPDDSGEQWDCLRCGQRMQRWKHAPGWHPQPGKSWFTHWYECINKACKTRQVMPRNACIKPGQEVPRTGDSGDGGAGPAEQQLCAEDIQRLAHFKAL